MSDDYQVRKDIDRIYRDVYSLDDDKINVVKFKDDEDDKSDLKQYGTIDKIFEVYGLGDVSARTDEKVNSIDLFNLVYPVGSIYMSVNDADPSMLFGGVWSKIEGQFLLASSDDYPLQVEVDGDLVENTGGEASVTLTANQSGLPVHSHGMAHTHSHNHTTSAYESGKASSGSAQPVPRGRTSPNVTGTFTSDTDATASSKSNTDNNTALNAMEAHNNMPPYLVVNIWKRTA